jgi:hypothetical protein
MPDIAIDRTRRHALAALACGAWAAPPSAAAQALVPTDAEIAAARRRAESAAQALGDRAGLPSGADKTQRAPSGARWLTVSEARAAFAPANARIEKLRWWRRGVDPATLTHALREPAAVISGCAAACRARLDDADRSLAIARDAAEFLLWAQAEAGNGGFPFPSTRGVRGSAAFASAESRFAKAEREGRLAPMLRNGWAVDDDGSGGLQFDNGQAGIAMLDLHALTGEPRYLASAVRAAEWAIERPVVDNWNYNSFSVDLLARTFEATREPRYRAAALRKALLGVMPGQLSDGPRAGRWFDAHNARPEYHYIMLSALTQLIAVMSPDDASRPNVVQSLRLGLTARNTDIVAVGAPTKNTAIEALLRVQRVFAADRAFLDDTQSTAALDVLGKLVSGQYLRGQEPLGPREWGLFLEHVAARR